MSLRESKKDWMATSIAIIAIILSQFRPLYQYFETANLDCFIPEDFIFVDHYYGMPYFQAFVQMKNTGKITGTVSKFVVYITREDKNIKPITIKPTSYIVQPERQGDRAKVMPFGEITLSPGQIWENVVIIRNSLPREAEYIKREIVRQNKDGNKVLYSKFLKIIKENYKVYQEGKYYIIATFWEPNKRKPTVIKGYQFTLNKKDIEYLRKTVEQPELRKEYKKNRIPVSLKIPIYKVQSEKINKVIKPVLSELL